MRDLRDEPPTEGTYYLDCQIVVRWHNARVEPSECDPGGFEVVDARPVALRFGDYDLPITEDQARAIAAAYVGQPDGLAKIEEWAIQEAFA